MFIKKNLCTSGLIEFKSVLFKAQPYKIESHSPIGPRSSESLKYEEVMTKTQLISTNSTINLNSLEEKRLMWVLGMALLSCSYYNQE